MRRSTALITCIALFWGVLTLAGCSIAGTWRTISVKPEQAQFPVTIVTFDKNGGFTATANYEGRPRTSTGQYKWNGTRLIVLPDNGSKRVYRGRLRTDGDLQLWHEVEGEKTTARLERMEQ